jgi:transposase
MHYIQPHDRNQLIFLNKLDDLVSQDNIIRLLDSLVDNIINTNPKEFTDKGVSAVGRRAYSPNLFIKLYIYGYFNGINSSRKLEKESQRNIELIWLLGNLQPDFKTIADFRKDNGDKIQLVLCQFSHFLKGQHYIAGNTISLDGTKLRANAGRSTNIEGIEKRLQNLQEQLGEYFKTLDQNDSDDDFSNSKEKEELLEKIRNLESKVEELQKTKEFLQSENLKYYSPTDPESRLMKSREGKHFCYNAQVTVDEKNKMLVTNEITQSQNDKDQLEPAIKRLSEENITPAILLADTGYFKTDAIKNVEENNKIKCYIPINYNKASLKDISHHIEFTYHKESDQYICSQGQILSLKVEGKVDNHRNTIKNSYQSANCNQCHQKEDCCPGKSRRVKWRHADQKWRDEYETRMKSEEAKKQINKRKALSEHPFGTIKYWMGKIPVKVKGIKKVQTEFNLYHIAYNFKRLTNVNDFYQIRNELSGFNWKIA